MTDTTTGPTAPSDEAGRAVPHPPTGFERWCDVMGLVAADLRGDGATGHDTRHARLDVA